MWFTGRLVETYYIIAAQKLSSAPKQYASARRPKGSVELSISIIGVAVAQHEISMTRHIESWLSNMREKRSGLNTDRLSQRMRLRISGG
jgi:hypothetical protein